MVNCYRQIPSKPLLADYGLDRLSACFTKCDWPFTGCIDTDTYITI